jgi:hypothetical protein
MGTQNAYPCIKRRRLVLISGYEGVSSVTLSPYKQKKEKFTEVDDFK